MLKMILEQEICYSRFADRWFVDRYFADMFDLRAYRWGPTD